MPTLLERTIERPLGLIGNPFDTPDFHECWWRHLSHGLDIPYKQNNLLVLRKKMIKGLLRLNEARISGWKVAWTQDLTEERVENLLRLNAEYGWDYFRMTWSENRRDLQQFELLQKAGYPIFQLDAKPHYVFDLSDGFDAYLKSLSHNGRKALKKKVRLAKDLNPQLLPVTDVSDIAPFYEELFSHHIPHWTQKTGYSCYSDPAEQAFTIDWATQMHQTGALRLERLIMGDETANLSMGIQMEDTFYWVLTINTEKHHDFAPGIVGLTLRMEQLAQEGVKIGNMGPGDFFYKEQSANRQHTCREMIVLNPRSLKARLYGHWLLRKHPDAIRL